MAPANVAPIATQGTPTVRLQCKKWDEFQTLALGAQTVSYNYKEEEKLFQADALKGNQVISYSGPLPNFSTLLKSYISKDLRVSEQSIFEGALDVS
jgi:hypothetical protein